MATNNNWNDDSYNWNEVIRPDHLRLVFSSMATALDINATESIILGRTVGNEIVDVDLTPFHAVDFGVSRQHAMIMPEGDGFVIKDLNSSNGTVLNGVRLEANKNYALLDGDMLFLGRMALTIRFVHEGARLSRRLPRAAADNDAAKKATKMLDSSAARKTRTVEMQGLLKKFNKKS